MSLLDWYDQLKCMADERLVKVCSSTVEGKRRRESVKDMDRCSKRID